MSDRNMIGILLILGGISLLLVPSHETAVRISGFVQHLSGVGALTAAFIVVGLSCLMILAGIVVLIRRG